MKNLRKIIKILCTRRSFTQEPLEYFYFTLCNGLKEEFVQFSDESNISADTDGYICKLDLALKQYVVFTKYPQFGSHDSCPDLSHSSDMTII